MAKVDKLIAKMLNQPNGITLREAEKVLITSVYATRNNMKEKRNAKFYLKQPYSMSIHEIHDNSGTYFLGRYPELEGCQSHADTIEELIKNMKIALEGYIESNLEHNIPIPLAKSDDDFSGRFMVRVPKSLHRKLVMEAEREGTSLNQYALYKLSK